MKVGAGLAIGLVGLMLTPAPSSAADRQGNQGRGTGWVLRGMPSSPNTDVWFGTHLFARAGSPNIDALCLDFARLGPRTAPAVEGDYQTFANTTGNPTADRQLTYLTAVVGSSVTADGLENDIATRNLAAAATVATWGIGEFVGFDEGPSGVWANAWLSGDASFLRPSPNDTGADTAAIAELFRLLRVGGGSLQFGSAVATVSGGGSLAPGTATSSLTVNVSVPGGGPVPLLPIRVDSVSNISGISLGQVFRTDANGNVGPIPVSLIDPSRGGGAGFSLGLATGDPSLWQSTRVPGRQRLVTTLVPNVVSSNGGLRVQKLSEQSLPIAGTRFEVRTAAGQVVGQLEIGNDGFSQTLPLPPGVYDVVETSVTPGHTVHVPVKANLISDVIATLPIKNLSLTELKVTSQVTSRTVAPGTTATDTITVAGLIGIERATVELELYDLTVNPAGGPLGTPLATYRVEGMSNGESRTFGSFTVPAELAGHLLGYRERISATGVPGADRSSDWTALGIPEETFQVTDNPGSPAISTNVDFGDALRIDSKRSASAVPIGEPVADTVFIHGLASDETATVEVELYDRTTSPPVFVARSTRTGVGNGRADEFTSYTPTADAAGHSFVFRHRIVSTTQGRSTDWSSFDVNEEAFVVNDLQLTSRVSASVVAVGGTVSDMVFLHGLAPNETATIALELFDLTTDPLGTGQPLHRFSRNGIGNGTTTGLAPYTVPSSLDGHEVGYRHRVETTTSGRSTPWSWLGDTTESFGVGRLNVGSFVTARSDGGDTNVTDAVFIEGLAPGETASAKLELFDLTVDPKGDNPPLRSWTAPGLGNGNNVSLAPFTAGANLQGHRLGYRHMITTSTGRTTPWSALGEPSETFFAGGDPCVANSGTAQVPVVGQVIFDKVSVAELAVGELATVELELFDLTADPTGQSPLARFTIPGLGNGTFIAGNFLVNAAHAGHRLSYRERIATTTLGRSTPFSALGAPSETVSVCGP
jgi:hypothetical protein